MTRKRAIPTGASLREPSSRTSPTPGSVPCAARASGTSLPTRTERSRPRRRLWRGLRVLGLAAVCAGGVVAAVALLRAPAAVRTNPTAPLIATGSPANPARARRAPLQSMFQDDELLVDSSTATVTRTLNQLRALGVQRLRVTVLWSSIAPNPLDDHAPAGFDPAQPGDYPD